MVQHTSPNVEP